MNSTMVRTITALILLFIASLCIYMGNKYFIYLTQVFTFLLQIEFALLLFKKKAPGVVLPFIAQSFALSIVFCYWPSQLLPLFLLFWIAGISIILILYSEREISELLFLIAAYVLGIVYVGLLPALTTKLMLTFNGPFWFFICIVVVFSGDIAAYFIGRKFGKHKLIASISPNKTWEGAVGGLGASVFFGTIIGKYFFPNFNTYELIAACAAAGCLAQSGDFFESLLKRTAGSKDSGFLLPGHGGFLDRFDGILFAITVFFYIAS